MIYLGGTISNPWAKGDWDELVCKSKMLTKNKAIEFDVGFDNKLIVELNGKITLRQDHAGFRFTIGLFRYSISFQFYDIRHWDNSKGAWEVYGEDNEQGS